MPSQHFIHSVLTPQLFWVPSESYDETDKNNFKERNITVSMSEAIGTVLQLAGIISDVI